jgi:hypothetical protein
MVRARRRLLSCVYRVLILAQTGCDCKFNIEAQKSFCLVVPAASAAGRKFKPPALRVVVDFHFS